jgi:hypothetical protein
MAMLLSLLLPLRKIYQLEAFITRRHLDNMAKVMLATGLLVAYGYLTEGFTAWYSGDPYDQFWLWNRSFGPYQPLFWALLVCNVATPQLLWSGRVRSNSLLLFMIAMMINVGMWLERFVIIVVSLHRDFLPSAWGLYWPTVWDWLTLVGSIGLFLTLIFLFIRFLPMISIFEMRQLLTETNKREAKLSTQERRSVPSGVQSTLWSPEEPDATALHGKLPRLDGALYGLLAEFDTPETLLEQARRTYHAGYRHISAYSPLPIEGLAEALGLRQTRLPFLVLLGGIAGALAGFALQYYAAVLDYPWNIGGRPLNSWPAFMIVTFELAILGAAGVAGGGMLLLNGLPRLYHPVFNAPRFSLASQERFFLCIKASDPNFDPLDTYRFLLSLQPLAISQVDP